MPKKDLQEKLRAYIKKMVKECMKESEDYCEQSYLKEQAPVAKPVPNLMKTDVPPVKGTKDIIAHETDPGKEPKYTEKSVCPHCGKPYTEEEKKKKRKKDE